MDTSIPTCPRHPDVETRLRCSSCDTLICPHCGHEAAVGYKCPDCAARDRGDGPDTTRPLAGLFGRASAAGRRSSGAPPGPSAAAHGSAGHSDRLPLSIGTRGTVVGLVAATVGGLLLGPVLLGGAFFLLSSGVIGWGVARSVYWATEERNSPYLRAIALTLAGFTVAIGLVMAGRTAAPAGILLLAYPAAVYGGWIVVRQR